MKRPSLQRRLLWLMVAPILLAWLAAGAWLGWRTQHETAEMFDRQLERTAANMLALAAELPPQAQPRWHAAEGDDPHGPDILVRDRTGRRMLSSSRLPMLAFAETTPHFHAVDHDGERWRVYQRWDASGRFWIQVAAPLHDRDELLASMARAIALPLLFLLGLLPLATWWALRRGLAPLRALSCAIATQPARTPTLTRDDVPAELLQFTRALDALVANLDGALARERRFTADAAHELRHPLSVLRMELDLAGRVDDPSAAGMHLQRARDGLERMERLVVQLLTLARVESLDRVDDAAAVSLATVARDVLADAGALAAPRNVVLTLDAIDPGLVHGSAGLLRIALRNLIDNAILHGRRDGRVEVAVRTDASQVEFSVTDDGLGLVLPGGGMLGARFQRGGGTGSGLGLSIVQAIAQLHHGSVQASLPTAGGTRMTLCLPMATGAAPRAVAQVRA
ncbi:ATP-binding protein [Cognatiluteimonas telluris]|uniref:ATP-binding protein n=1 Tax=Cognatiluteimonas telluris TaxID=1104775 RepID=UPI00140836B9|nr:ATP-binding protein [Lysobacter telluris]